MNKDINFADMSWDDLESLEKAIHFEKVNRKEKRFNELAKTAAEALTALKDEYPYVELTFEVRYDDCGGSLEVNLFDYFKRFGAGHFSMG